MVLVTITFPKDEITPPVYVAGSFSNWQPIEMNHEQIRAGEILRHKYLKQLDLRPGSYEYKFRLGSGDWWIADEAAPTNQDSDGNLNNIIEVYPEGTGAVKTPPTEAENSISQDAPASLCRSTSPAVLNETDEDREASCTLPTAGHSPSSTTHLVNQHNQTSSTTQSEVSQQRIQVDSKNIEDDSTSPRKQQAGRQKFCLPCCIAQTSIVIAGLALGAAIYLAWWD